MESPRNFNILTKAMKYFLWLSKYPMQVIIMTMVLFGVDLLDLPIRTIISIGPNIFSFLIRSILIITFINELLKSINAFFILGLTVVCSASEVLHVLNSLNYKRTIWIERNLQTREIQLYRQLSVWMGFTNKNFCYFAVPPLLFFGVSFIILGLYGTVRMRDRMPFLLYLLLPISSLMASSFVVFMIPEAAKVYEGSNLYLCKTGKDLGRGTWEKKVVRALRPVAVQIGPFGLVRNNLMKIVISVLTEHTSNLLITF
ncbi:hypothetical protein Fcan01_10259 [Folsomia candida]|uniref:Uncharacterized protein n=1 Tax=Folsomia candida TaxID=158441 RepID=A0A226EAF2_FOLCA|nr:hypothetical protein Fcan01_10259 [Folsomia candida]